MVGHTHNKCYIFGDPLPSLESDVNYADHVLKKFSSYKDKVAIIDAVTGERLSYNEVVEMTKNLAVSFTRIGVRKGHRIAICAEERLDSIPTILAAIYVGAVYTFIDPEGPAVIAHKMNLVQPDVIICTPKAYQDHKTLLEQPCVKTFIVYGDDRLGANYSFNEILNGEGTVDPAEINGLEDLAGIAYSSGTTGPSKGIPITHLALLNCLFNHIDLSAYRDKKVLIAPNFPPLWLAFLYAGATTVFMHGETDKDIIEAADKYKVDAMQQMPTTVTATIRSPLLAKADLSSVHRILTCSSPLTARLVQEIHQKMPSVKTVCQLYGATEVGGITSEEMAKSELKPNSVGVAVPGVVIKVVDLKTGEPLGPNQRGEICVKGSVPIPAYLGVSSTDHIDSEGFYKTGDIGYYDDDHYFYLVDRIKDIIKFNGYAVAPQDLEEIITSHKEVLEAAVIGAPHDQFYEMPTAFVVLRAGSEMTTDDVTKFTNDQVPSYMHLAGGSILLKELPRGKRGKIDRKALRKRVQAM